VLWRGTAAVLGVQSVGSDKVRSRGSGEKRAEDVLPSWRSTRSLAIKETALDYERESRCKRRNFEMMLFLADVGVKENRKSLLCKKSGGRLAERGVASGPPENWPDHARVAISAIQVGVG